MDTTRRYPRSLADAFPAERAACIELPPRRMPVVRLVAVSLLAILSFVIVLAFAG